MTVNIDRQNMWDGSWMLKTGAASHSKWRKKGHSAHHNIKDLYCFPNFLYIYKYIFVQQDASQQVMICSNVCFPSLLDLAFFFFFLYPLPQALAGCLHYALKLGGVINS